MLRILYRDADPWGDEEALAARSVFQGAQAVTAHRSRINEGDLVIGRYSVLPFYKEVEADLNAAGAKLINTHKQHRYVADLKNWYSDLEDYTFKTYFNLHELPQTDQAWVLKGETNSHKFMWSTHMFAKDWQTAKEIYYKLLDDTLIGQQQIYIREYCPLKTYITSINGLPVTDEYRIFVCNQKILSIGYYWANHVEDLEHTPVPRHDWRTFAEEVIERVGDNCTFYTLDIGLAESGQWKVVELNDGQMSGLSCNNPFEMYAKLKTAVIPGAASAAFSTTVDSLQTLFDGSR